jgi:hypothetical protein
MPSLCCLYDRVQLILRFICNLVWTSNTQWLFYVSSKFNILKFYVLPTEFINVFCVDLKNSYYFIFSIKWHHFMKGKPCFHCTAGSGLYLQLRLMSVFKEINMVSQNRNFRLSTAMITTWRVCEFVKVTETRGGCFQGLKKCMVVSLGKESKFSSDNIFLNFIIIKWGSWEKFLSFAGYVDNSWTSRSR